MRLFTAAFVRVRFGQKLIWGWPLLAQGGRRHSITTDRRNRSKAPSQSIRVTSLRALNERPLLEEERKTSAPAEDFSVGPATDIDRFLCVCDTPVESGIPVQAIPCALHAGVTDDQARERARDRVLRLGSSGYTSGCAIFATVCRKGILCRHL